MKKTLISLFTLLVALCTIMLSSCSSFFEEETLMIESVKATNMDDGRTKITITYVDDVEEPLVFYIPQGPTGEQGEQGVGIEDIDYEELENGNTLITIKVTDDEIPPVQFEVQNGIKILSLKEGVDALSGEKYIFFEYNDGTYSEEIIIPSGKNGIGIKDCATVPNDDGGYTLTIILDDEREYSVIIPGPEKGETGLGIDNKDGKKGVVGGVSADGTKYVITFYYTDGSSESVEFARPNQWHWTNGKPANSLGAVGDYCFDTTNNDIYVKDRPNSWANIFDMDSVETTHTVKFDLNAYIFNEESQTYERDTTAKLNGLSVYSNIKHGSYLTSNEGCEIPIPTRSGYIFKGWYTDRSVTEISGKFTKLTIIADDITLFAQWEEDTNN